MLIAKVDENGDVVEYPITVAEMRKRCPNVSFPDDLTGCDLRHLGYSIVPEVKPPKAKEGHRIILGPPTRKGKWLKRTFVQEPIPETNQ